MKKIKQLSEFLDVRPHTLAGIEQRIPRMLMEESTFFELEIGSFTELLESANHLIYKQYLLVETLLQDCAKKQEQVTEEKVKEVALKSLKTIIPTFSHHINNITASMVTEADGLQWAISKGKVMDDDHVASNYAKLAATSVQKINAFLNILENIQRLDTTRYVDDVSILDLGDELEKRFKEIDRS